MPKTRSENTGASITEDECTTGELSGTTSETVKAPKFVKGKKEGKAAKIARAKVELLELRVELAAARLAAIEIDDDSDNGEDEDSIASNKKLQRLKTWLNYFQDKTTQAAAVFEPPVSQKAAENKARITEDLSPALLKLEPLDPQNFPVLPEAITTPDDANKAISSLGSENAAVVAECEKGVTVSGDRHDDFPFELRQLIRVKNRALRVYDRYRSEPNRALVRQLKAEVKNQVWEYRNSKREAGGS